jgi:hypothetical protein
MSFWFEELDGYTTNLVKSPSLVISQDKSKHSNQRFARADVFDSFLKIIVEALDQHRATSHRPLGGKQGSELRLAYSQFTDFDYRLISLCYGADQHRLRYAIHNGFSKEHGPDFPKIRTVLDRYFRTNDATYVSELLEVFRGFEQFSSRSGTGVEEALAKVEDRVEGIWIQGLLEGRKL